MMEPKDFAPGHDMTFDEWLEVTVTLQQTAFGQDPPALEGDERADWLMMNFFAAQCEIVELADEAGWKPWTQPRGWVNREAMISEIADCMHFLGNILATISCTGEELTETYLTKVRKNYARQERGDDIRDRRCPGCGRSLDDVGIARSDDGVSYQCKACGLEVPQAYTIMEIVGDSSSG